MRLFLQCGTNIWIIKYIWIYWDKYFICLNILIFNIFSRPNILGYSFVIYLYLQIYLNIHCSISMIANIFEFSLFLKNIKNWLIMVQNGSICVQKHTKYGNGQVIPNKFKHIFWYLNLFEYFWQIYSFAKLFVDFFLGQIYLDIYLWSFHPAEYIRIFIHWIYMVTNIIEYSFVQKNYICPTLYSCSRLRVILQACGSAGSHWKRPLEIALDL